MATAPEIMPGTHRHTEHIIYELAKSIRERDVLTYDHSRRVAIYANRLARHTGWSRRGARDLALAGLVHDLGKTWIKNAVLHKESALSLDEREEMQRHPVIAARILQIYAAPEHVVQAVLHHHEAYDGTGYPYGLHGQLIPDEARILTVADVFDALTSARPYREALSIDAARDWIAAGAGTRYDPEVTAALADLIRMRDEFLIQPRVQTLVPLETPDGWVDEPRLFLPPGAMQQPKRTARIRLRKSLAAALATVPDPRARRVRYPLPAVLTLAVVAMLDGAVSARQIAEWGAKRSLEELGELGFASTRPPVTATFRRIFNQLDRSAFDIALRGWLLTAVKGNGPQVQADTEPAPLALSGEELPSIRVLLEHRESLHGIVSQ